MRKNIFPLGALFALAIALITALPSVAANKPHPAQANSSLSKKVWTNDDMDQLHWRGLISIVGQEPVEAAPQTAAAQAEANFPVYESRLDDPSWYADQAALLQAELEKRQAALAEQQAAIANRDAGATQGGLAMDKPGAGVTPADAVANLAAGVQEIQSQLDELSDLARQHDIPPGVLRG
jgi:hypothetical protein